MGLRAYGADSLIMVAVEDGRLNIVASWGLDQATIDALTDRAAGHSHADRRRDGVAVGGVSRLGRGARGRLPAAG